MSTKTPDPGWEAFDLVLTEWRYHWAVMRLYQYSYTALAIFPTEARADDWLSEQDGQADGTGEELTVMPVRFKSLEAWNSVEEPSREVAQLCKAQKDGECFWGECPQAKDGEPIRSGRHCPLDNEHKSISDVQQTMEDANE